MTDNRQSEPLQKIPEEEMERIADAAAAMFPNWRDELDEANRRYYAYIYGAKAEYLHAHQSVSWPDGGEVPQKVKDWILSQTLFCGGVTVEDNIAWMSGFEKGAVAMYRKLAEESQQEKPDRLLIRDAFFKGWHAGWNDNDKKYHNTPDAAFERQYGEQESPNT